jgi:hypothetical protein
MNVLARLLIHVYLKMLNLYPRNFRNEFAEEMKVVFMDSLHEALHEGTLFFTFVCLKELGGLPLSILREFWHEFKRKETKMLTSENADPKSGIDKRTNHWDAIVGTLPFALFGIATMIGKSRLPFHAGYSDLAFCAVMLNGLVIGLAKGFPRWAYSYLGWSMVMSWSWTMMPMDTFRNSYSPITHNQLLGWWSWIPFLIAIGIGLLFARSFRPIRQLILGIWQDWTLASFMIYTFVAFVLLIYDENHHLYLFLFMIASTVILSASAWFFLRSIDTREQVASLLAGFVLSFTVMMIGESTWDWRTYYGHPRATFVAEYMSALRFGAFLVFYGMILFLPALLGPIRNAINNRRMA